MHIPDSMLQNTLCTATLVVGAGSLIAAVHFARKTRDRPTALRFGAITALILAAQMMNFPIMGGVSGHLIGGVLAAALLGVPFGVLAVSLVIAVQALLLGDGGIDALGANILNMAALGAGLGGTLYSALRARCSEPLAMAIASWGAVMLAALAVSVELAMGGRGAFLDVAPAMLGVHALIGLGEAFIAVLAYGLLSSAECGADRRAGGLLPLGLAAGLVLFSPLASAWPDGLTWVTTQQGWVPASASALLLQAGMAGVLFGLLAAFAGGWGLMHAMGRGEGTRQGI
jgi:cobalt/nickel transport system permease protein